MDRAGSFWHGRALPWNPRQRAAEHERQKWVSSAVSDLNQVITDLAVDPAEAYRVHRDEYVRTGDLAQLQLALEYVQP